MSGPSDERGTFARRLHVLCRPLLLAGWSPVRTTLVGEDLYDVSEFDADGRGMPALLRRGNRYVQVTAFEHGGLRIDSPFAAVEGEGDYADLPVNGVAGPASLGAEDLCATGQPRRFYELHGLLP